MRRAVSLVLVVGLCLFAAPVYPARLAHREFRQVLSGDRTFSLRLDVDAGEIRVQPSEGNELLVIAGYDSSAVSYEQKFDPDFRRFRIDLRVRSWFRQQKKAGKERIAVLDVRVPMSVPVELSVRTKAGETRLDLGGLRLRRLKLDALAGETRLSFSKRNPEVLRRLKINQKVGELRIERLSNANFETAEIHGGVGELDIDLSGCEKPVRAAVLELRLGVGTATVHAPGNCPVRFEIAKRLLSSVDVDRQFRRVRGGYESPSYNEENGGLVVRVKAGVGSLEILAE